MFQSFVYPAAWAAITFLFMSPIMLRKQSMCETLHCTGNMDFFGDPFPETLVSMKLLRRTPKPSRSWTYETLVYRNMTARLINLTKPAFWKLWWKKMVVQKACCSTQNRVIDKLCIIFRLPFSITLLILHAIPIFSVWSNYLQSEVKLIFLCDGREQNTCTRMMKVPMLIMTFFGIFCFYLMIWNFMVRLFAGLQA